MHTYTYTNQFFTQLNEELFPFKRDLHDFRPKSMKRWKAFKLLFINIQRNLQLCFVHYHSLVKLILQFVSMRD